MLNVILTLQVILSNIVFKVKVVLGKRGFKVKGKGEKGKLFSYSNLLIF